MDYSDRITSIFNNIFLTGENSIVYKRLKKIENIMLDNLFAACSSIFSSFYKHSYLTITTLDNIATFNKKYFNVTANNKEKWRDLLTVPDVNTLHEGKILLNKIHFSVKPHRSLTRIHVSEIDYYQHVYCIFDPSDNSVFYRLKIMLRFKTPYDRSETFNQLPDGFTKRTSAAYDFIEKDMIKSADEAASSLWLIHNILNP